MYGYKKRKSVEESSPKRKKIKMNSTTNDLTGSETFDDAAVTELLEIKTVREGMLLLGCVTEVRKTSFKMSLPGCLSGTVHARDISYAFHKSFVKKLSLMKGVTVEPPTDPFVKVGMVFPCRVIEIVKNESRKKTDIYLSIEPKKVNADLKPSSIYLTMVLYVSVCSIEDHGYIVDTGNKDIHGFLLKQHSEDKSKMLRTGEIIPTSVQEINLDKGSVNIKLSKLDFSEEFPKTLCHDIKLPDLLPGARIECIVLETRYPLVFMKYLDFKACASVLSIRSAYKTIKVGSVILGTVLYVHPITRMIYLMLSEKPSPDNFAGYFGFSKFDLVNDLDLQHVSQNRVYYNIKQYCFGYINLNVSHTELFNEFCVQSFKKLNDLSGKGRKSITTTVYSEYHKIQRASVIALHYMDNFVQLIAKQVLVDGKLVFTNVPEIGDVYDGVVKSHVKDGMYVTISPGICGFVRRLHMSDVFVTKPERIHPTGSEIKCRVLTINEYGKVGLTCKESLLHLPEAYILSSYNNAHKGQVYKGVVVEKKDTYVLVVFFNDVKGIVSSSNIPQGSVFYVGQVVLCEVIDRNVSKCKLKLRLQTEGLCSVEEIEDFWDMPSTNNTKKATTSPSAKVSDSDKPKILELTDNFFSNDVQESDDNDDQCVEALITKVKGEQLNILLNESKGRVHITQLGCTSENIHPLRKFSVGQKIPVYIIGTYNSRKNNFSEITHRNMVSFKECSLLPSVSLQQDLQPSTSLIGFVKEVFGVSAVIWLSTTKTGVLHFLHFSKNLKEVKKARQLLKVGLSLKVSILDYQPLSPDEKDDKQRLKLSVIEKKLPQVGDNMIGLVQISCIHTGLILKLPFGYRGVVDLTDLSDIYAPAQLLFVKYLNLRYVMCHILLVNHGTQYCQVSLRKSRVYKKIPSHESYSPEVLLENVKQGDKVKGYITSTSETALNVTFGRNLIGTVHLHKCIERNCALCTRAKSILCDNPVGFVEEFIIEEMSVKKKTFTLVFSESSSLEHSQNNRLSINEDISWNEVK